MSDEERRGRESAQLLANPLLAEAFAAIEQRLVSELTDLNMSAEKRERAQLLLALGRKYQQYLQQVVTTGVMAEMELERRKTLADRVRRFAA